MWLVAHTQDRAGLEFEKVERKEEILTRGKWKNKLGVDIYVAMM